MMAKWKYKLLADNWDFHRILGIAITRERGEGDSFEEEALQGQLEWVKVSETQSLPMPIVITDNTEGIEADLLMDALWERGCRPKCLRKTLAEIKEKQEELIRSYAKLERGVK
jgi:hypothetical protein